MTSPKLLSYVQKITDAFPEGDGSYLSIDALHDMCPGVPWLDYLNDIISVKNHRIGKKDQIHVGEAQCVEAMCKLLKETRFTGKSQNVRIATEIPCL